MVEVDFSGNFLNTETCKNEDVGVILSEGRVESKTSKMGKPYNVLEIDVEVNNKKLIYEVYMQVGKILQKAWGKDSKNWIGKRFKCIHVNYTSFGQRKTRVDIEPLEIENGNI